MKHNGKNIITSEDVTVLGKNAGKTLSEVLETLLEDSQSLKSNIKWIYKYGGVGGKGGGGTDSSTYSDKWYSEVIIIPNNADTKLVPLVDSTTTSDNYTTYMFESASRIHINIKLPYALEFRAKIYFGGKYIGSTILNPSEGYSKDFNININTNGNLEIEISDTGGIHDPKNHALRCICDAYNFSDQILYGNGIEIMKSSRGIYVSFIDDIISRENIKYNLIASTYYKFPLRIEYTTIDGVSGNILFNEDSSKLYNNERLFSEGLPIINNIEEFLYNEGNLNYEKAGTYTFNVKKYILKSDNTEDLIENTNFLIDVVPSNLYLSILPRYEGKFIIYNDNTEEEPEYTYVGSKEFSLTPYNGKTFDGSQIYLKINVDGTDYQYYGSSVISVTTRETIYPSLRITLGENDENEKWVPITFSICPDNLFDIYNTKTFVRYLYVKKYDQAIKWYFDKDSLSQYFKLLGTHYRFGETSSSNYVFKDLNNNTLDGNNIISRSNSNENILEITSNHLAENLEVEECMINIGLLYNDINDDSLPIIKITTASGSSNFSTTNTTDITIYQNSIYYGSVPIGYADTSENGTNYISGFFIGKELDYNSADMSKYLLLTITRRCIKNTSEEGESLSYYEIAVYINGILQTCKSGFEKATPVYSKIILNNCNFSINLLDIQYLSNNSISDASVVRYWYSFNTNILENSENIEIKENLLNTFHTEVSREIIDNNITGRVKITEAGFLTLCGLDSVPIMCLSSDSSAYNGESFMDWSDRWRDANGSLAPTDNRNVSVFWKPLSKTFEDITKIVPISPIVNTGDDGVINGQFNLKVQGSTTRTYKSKNYTLTLNGESNASGKYIPIFTPKFELVLPSDSEETKKYKYNHSFLPENSFTLKADVVDSSHTNNTCMGQFINDISTKFNLAGALSGQYVDYIKNCLLGFPFLLFVKETTTDEYYYLGIYNFNLGRNSYFNLGYVDISLLDNFDIKDNLSEIYYVEKEKYKNVRRNFISAEVLDNKAEFDFSLYDQSILFKLGKRDVRYMFDDIVPDKDDLTAEKASISNFVKRISRAGGYIFLLLGKGFLSEDLNVSSSSHPLYGQAHYVPLATQLWIKYEDNFGNIQYVKKSNKEADFVLEDLTNCISSHENYSGDNEEAYCDYTGLVEYYTICMAFGLLDNVEKNLTIKTWNNNTYHVAFYDMDTCLGINNESGDVKYFAFSDYWGSTEELSPYTINVIGEENALPVYVLGSIDILRDHTPNTVTKKDFFDTPSSYLFAIAKYAKSILGSNGGDLITPLDLWAYWRSNLDYLTGITATKVGCLQNAQTFLDNYYLKYMEGIDELMFNYNYRAKYFKDSGSSVYGEELKRFHGDRHNYVKDWLTKRFHILDAYFNLNRSTIPINDGQEILDGLDALYDEPKYSFESLDFTSNPDVQITKDIFSTAGTSYNSPDPNDINTQLIVKAPDYTPLMIREGNSIIGRFLLNDDSRYYSINFSGGGASTRINFYGSTLWTYLHNINFMHNTCDINSRYLENLVGFSGAISTWSIKMPSVKVISLTSSNYSGTLNLNQNELSGSEYFLLPNLKTIDISGSKISLNVNSGNIKDINLDNISSTDLTIANCYSLSSVSCNNIKISGNCSLAVSWTKNFTLSNCNINNLDISSLYSDPGKLTISGDNTMTNLKVKTFKEIAVSNCSKLLKFISPSTSVLKINISNCTSLSLAEINVTSCLELILDGCNLQSLKLIANRVEDFLNVKILRIKGASFENIECELTADSSLIINSSDTQYLLDLLLFSKLTDFYIKLNKIIKYILFANEITPIKITSKKPFEGCDLLERIYGNIQFKDADHLFDNLLNFSIHGPSNTGTILFNGVTYSKTKQVLIDGQTLLVIQTPFLLVSGESESETEWTHLLITTAYNNLINGGISSLYLSGTEVTNISFTSDVNKTFDYIGNNSSLTLFDIYYLFNIIALSNISTSGLTFSYAFYNGGTQNILNRLRTFKFSEGNLFNRYMFYGCLKIGSLGNWMFPPSYSDNGINSISLSGEHVIYPPTTDSQGNVLLDDGLLSPLINLSTIYVFCATCYSNRFLFRRASGKYNSLTSFSHLSFVVFLDDINNYKVKPSSSVVLNDNNYGSLEGLFDDTPNISTLLCVFDTSSVIDYSTLKFPTSINSIVNCFNASYGKGVFDWETTFDKTKDYNSLLHIDNSFRISSGVDGIPVNFELYDTMFYNMPNIVSIGYDYTDPNKHGNRGSRSTVDYYGTRALLAQDSSTTFVVGFSGNGYNKILRNGEFPYDILQKVGTKNTQNNQTSKSNIRSFGGLFSYLSGSSLNNEQSIRFPDNMFKGINNLEDISGLFMYSTIPITLTSKGFSDCQYLLNVTRLFYISESNDIGNIIGSIPANFFYIGELQNSKTYYTNVQNVSYDTIDVVSELLSVGKTLLSSLTDEELESINLRKVTVTYNTPKKFIKYATECFYGLNNLSYYEWDGSNYLNELYKNPNYIPVEHYIDEETKSWVTRENTSLYTCEYDISNLYDGNNLNLIPGTYCKDSDTILVDSTINPGKEGDYHYICPSDLFNSFSNVSDVSIRGIFKWCGYSDRNASHSARRGSTAAKALSGRIPPYLFDPISNISYLMETFEWCKGLTTYQIDGDPNYYMLPPTIFDKLINLTDVSKMLAGTYINNNINWPFTKLRKSLNIRGLFSSCKYEDNVTMASLFNGLALTNISGVFCTYILTLNNNSYTNINSISTSNSLGQGVSVSYTVHLDRFYNSNVKLSNNFSNSRITNGNFTKFLFLGYPSSDVGLKIFENSLSSILLDTSLQNIGTIIGN